jgi:hypothetical protein
MTVPASVSALIGELSRIAPSVRVETEEFPSSAVWLDVFVGEHWFVLSAGPTSGVGVSDNSSGKKPFNTHDRYFDTIDQAGSHLLALVRSTVAKSTPQPV